MMPEATNGRLWSDIEPSLWPFQSLQEVAAESPNATTIGPFGSNLVAGDYRAEGVPVVFVRDIKEEGFVWKSDVYVDQGKARELSAHQVLPGDVLATKMGLPPCVSCIYPVDMPQGIVTADVIRLRANPEVALPGWVSRQINSPSVKKQVGWITGGVTRPKVTLKDFRSLRIPTPPIPEQARIAEVLDALDEAIGVTQALVEKNGRIYQVLQERFFAPHAVLNRNWWQESRLEDISESITSGPRGWACYYKDEGDYFLRIGNLTRKHLDLRFDDVVNVQPPVGAEGVRTALAPGDLLISITADLGIIGVVPEWMGVAYINQHIARARLNRVKVNPRFLGYQLSGQIGQKQFYRLNDVGAKAGLNLPTVGRLKVWLPPQAEQNQIAQALDTVQMSLRNDEVTLAKLLGLKSGLSSDLLTGRVRVLEAR